MRTELIKTATTSKQGRRFGFQGRGVPSVFPGRIPLPLFHSRFPEFQTEVLVETVVLRKELGLEVLTSVSSKLAAVISQRIESNSQSRLNASSVIVRSFGRSKCGYVDELEKKKRLLDDELHLSLYSTKDITIILFSSKRTAIHHSIPLLFQGLLVPTNPDHCCDGILLLDLASKCLSVRKISSELFSWTPIR